MFASASPLKEWGGISVPSMGGLGVTTPRFWFLTHKFQLIADIFAVIQATIPKKLFISLSFLLLLGCQIRAPSKKVAQSQPQKILIQLPPMRAATLVNIKNDWNGYSDITPIERHYQFKTSASGLYGEGYFAVGGYGAYNIRQQYTKKIAIPALVTQQFFQELNKTKIYSTSHYQPIKKRRDDYPAITIQVTTPEQKVTFFSSSQGQDHTPWQIKITEKTKEKIYVSESTAPATALLLLKPYIDHPGLEDVINKLRSPRPQINKSPKTYSSQPK